MNEFLICEYQFIFVCFILALALAIIIFFLSYLIMYQTNSRNKLSAYECGFEAFEPSRERFDVHFYIVGILFIIFDLEIIFLIPWAVSIKFFGLFGSYSLLIFLFILTLGFIYEWLNKALDWPKVF